MSEANFSEGNLLRFLDYAEKKGLFKTATIRSRRIAVQKVLGVLDDQEKRDLQALDREVAFQRFVNIHGMTFTPDSLVTYKSRFNSALDDFVRWTENPAAFKPGVATRQSRKGVNGTSPKASTRPKKLGTVPLAAVTPSLPALPAPLKFPVPIRAGVVVELHNVPNDLSQDEAKRIAAVITALAVPTGTK